MLQYVLVPFINMKTRHLSVFITIVVSFFILVVLLFNLSLAVRTEIGRDETMYVAVGYAISKLGLLPYRDFPLLHFPYHLLLEALLFRFTDNYFLAARFLSAVCATGSAAVIFFLSTQFARHLLWPWRLFIACGSILLLIGNPLAVFTSGLAWNYVLSTFLALLSFMAFVQAYRVGLQIQEKNEKSRPNYSQSGWLLASGLTLGLAIGSRISMLTLLPAYIVGILLLPGDSSSARMLKPAILRNGLFFGAGLLIALLPLLYFFSIAPKQFIFENFTYHTLNTVFRQESNFTGPITFPERWDYFWNTVMAMPGNLLVFLGVLFFGLAIFGVSMLHNAPSDAPSTSDHPRITLLVTLLLLILFSLIGSFIAVPAWLQYFYPPLLFAVLFISYCVSQQLPQDFSRGRLFSTPALLFALLALLVTFFRVDDYRRVTFLFHPEAWRPLMIRQAGIDLQKVVPSGKVLTLTPIIPLEAGLQIYPEFIDMFFYRILPYMSPEQRQMLGLPLLEDLKTDLAADPPAAILVGAETTLEQPLIEYAQSLGYHPVPISETLTVWVPSP
jgi:hypothetical protein